MTTYEFEISIPGEGDQVIFCSCVYKSRFEVFKAVDETKASNNAPKASQCTYKVYEYADRVHRKQIKQ